MASAATPKVKIKRHSGRSCVAGTHDGRCCKNTQFTTDISFHKFPDSSVQPARTSFMGTVRRDMARELGIQAKLKPDAVPTIDIATLLKADEKNLGARGHRQDKALRKAWITRMKRKHLVVSRYSLVCSLHFTKESFKRSPDLRKIIYLTVKAELLPDAVPTVTHSQHSHSHRKAERPLNKAQKTRLHSEILRDLLAAPIATVDYTEPENDIILNDVQKDDKQLVYTAEMLQPRPALVMIDCQTTNTRKYRSAQVQAGPKTVVKSNQTNIKPRQRSFGIQCDLLPAPVFPKLKRIKPTLVEQDTSDSDLHDEQIPDDPNDLPYELSSSDSSSTCSETSNDE
ncbi:hypothetical protein GQR58_027699 [Nymphon striatum]|nr:hypothetical protein GQR58_027699 [Nymphon striatum]